MPQIDVIAKGDFGYHPASGEYLHQGQEYSIEEEAFSPMLFEHKHVEAEIAGEESAAHVDAAEGGAI